MFNNNKILVVIPARGGSKGIPRKNIRLLGGKPLIAHTIEITKSSEYVDELVVTTDDNEIAFVYVYDEEVEIDNLTIQKEELDSVEWFDLEEVYQACQPPRDEKFCVPMGGLEIVRKYVKADERRSEGMASGMVMGNRKNSEEEK